MCCVLYHLYLCTCVVGIATVSQTLELSFKVNCFSPHSTILSTNEQGAPSESYLQEEGQECLQQCRFVSTSDAVTRHNAVQS